MLKVNNKNTRTTSFIIVSMNLIWKYYGRQAFKFHKTLLKTVKKNI